MKSKYLVCDVSLPCPPAQPPSRVPQRVAGLIILSIFRQESLCVKVMAVDDVLQDGVPGTWAWG